MRLGTEIFHSTRNEFLNVAVTGGLNLKDLLYFITIRCIHKVEKLFEMPMQHSVNVTYALEILQR